MRMLKFLSLMTGRQSDSSTRWPKTQTEVLKRLDTLGLELKLDSRKRIAEFVISAWSDSSWWIDDYKRSRRFLADRKKMTRDFKRVATCLRDYPNEMLVILSRTGARRYASGLKTVPAHLEVFRSAVEAYSRITRKETLPKMRAEHGAERRRAFYQALISPSRLPGLQLDRETAAKVTGLMEHEKEMAYSAAELDRQVKRAQGRGRPRGFDALSPLDTLPKTTSTARRRRAKLDRHRR
jgi:hypothetical protein